MIANLFGSIVESFGRPREKNALGFSQGWTGIVGGKTKSGSSVTERSAEALSAVYSATRVITEGLAQLPLELREAVDARTTRAATDHHLYPLMHDRPNREMTRFQFFDYQIPFQINWGDAFAEKQRDAVTGKVVALWPIHHSRVKVVRGPYVDSYGEVLGVGRTLVYLVRNNNGTTSALEADDVLHVPGVMDPESDTNCGRGLVRVAAETLGIVEATQGHVAAFHRNGATPDIVVAFKGNIPPEDKQALRDSWSKKHGGTENAHKALILSGDPTVTPVSINPKDALLIDGQRFGVEEVGRFWRVPPHLLYELGRATWSNIEDMGTDFVTFTLQAWIQRWEGALNTQLLTPAEQERLYFKFNIKGFLRGNSAARLAYFQGRFNMGTLNQDEIRELEDENPLPDGLGQRYFIQGNNFVPLDRIDDAATMNAPAGPAADADPVVDNEIDAARAALQSAAQQLLATALDGLIRYESHKATLHAAKAGFDQWCETFYAGPFREAFDKAVGPVLTGARSLGCTVSLDAFASAHITQSKSELLALFAASQDLPFKTFESKLSQTLSGWTARAAVEAAAAFEPTPTE